MHDVSHIDMELVKDSARVHKSHLLVLANVNCNLECKPLSGTASCSCFNKEEVFVLKNSAVGHWHVSIDSDWIIEEI